MLLVICLSCMLCNLQYHIDCLFSFDSLAALTNIFVPVFGPLRDEAIDAGLRFVS